MTNSDAQPTAHMDAKERMRRQKNRRLFIGVALCFVVPLAAAKLILNMGWYTPGVTNKGVLLNPPLEISRQDQQALPDQWRLAVRVPNDCNERCVNSLYVISQTDLALGRDSSRVTPVAIQATPEVAHLPSVGTDSRIEYLHLPTLHQQLASFPEGSVMIIDPLGFVIMRYEGSAERAVAIQHGRDMLDDLKKLLKMSRVG